MTAERRRAAPAVPRRLGRACGRTGCVLRLLAVVVAGTLAFNMQDVLLGASRWPDLGCRGRDDASDRDLELGRAGGLPVVGARPVARGRSAPGWRRAGC